MNKKCRTKDKHVPATPLASTKADFRQVRENGGATVDELRAFLKQLKGRSPQEMLGIVAASQLVRAIGVSTAVVVAGLIVFTAIPYAMGGDEEPTQEATTQPPVPQKAPAQPSPTSTPSKPDGGTVPENANLGKLGVDETKEAPPNVNPLEEKKDGFLDGLD